MTTITDDEGKKVGEWRYTDRNSNFDVSYQGKSYSGCGFSSSNNSGGQGSGNSAEVVCTSASERITFKPQFGEVHFVSLVNGPSRHDDGLSFVTRTLNTSPAQYVTTITDDEGKKVGEWRYTDRNSKFDVSYQSKTYKGCGFN